MLCEFVLYRRVHGKKQNRKMLEVSISVGLTSADADYGMYLYTVAVIVIAKLHFLRMYHSLDMKQSINIR